MYPIFISYPWILLGIVLNNPVYNRLTSLFSLSKTNKTFSINISNKKSFPRVFQSFEEKIGHACHDYIVLWLLHKKEHRGNGVMVFMVIYRW